MSNETCVTGIENPKHDIPEEEYSFIEFNQLTSEDAQNLVAKYIPKSILSFQLKFS